MSDQESTIWLGCLEIKNPNLLKVVEVDLIMESNQLNGDLLGSALIQIVWKKHLYMYNVGRYN